MKNNNSKLKIIREDANVCISKIILVILFFLPVYLLKIKFGWASFNLLEILVAALFLVWIFNKEKKYQMLNTKYKLPIALIFIGLILSVIANGNYHNSLGATKGWFVFPILFAIIFFDALKKDERLLKKFLLASFSSGVAVSGVGVIYEFLGALTYDGRLKAFWDSPNQLAMFLAVPFLIGVYFFLQEKEVKKKRLRALSAILIGLSLYFTFSYGAWLALSAALIIIIWLEYGKKKHKKYLAIFALLLIAFLAWASLNKYKSIANLGERSSLASRVMIWQSAGLMIEKHPLLGIGPGNFQEKYLEYQKYFPPYLEWSAPQPHNIFLAFWLESGILGLAGFVWLMILFFRDNKKTIERNRNFGILFLAIMTYILIHGLVDTTYWRNDLAVVFWMVVAANKYLAKKDN